MANESKTLVISILALLISSAGMVISAITYHATHMKGPEFTVLFGSEVLLQGRRSLGITCVLINSGPRPGVIAGLKAELVPGAGAPLRPVLLTVRADELRKTPAGEEMANEETYSYFSPIPVAGGGEETRTIWFFREMPWLPETEKPGVRVLRISAYTDPAGPPVAVSELRIVVDDAALACINRHAGKALDCPADTQGWDGLYGIAQNRQPQP